MIPKINLLTTILFIYIQKTYNDSKVKNNTFDKKNAQNINYF
ncbi:unnamed protein product, partial [Vitis vinifera]|uniref:Uncharacterized protein n=1 Tax=Vitis vinifera TaxID=29760 RepID=D7T6S2_VITVI